MVKITHPSMQKGRDPAGSAQKQTSYVVEDLTRGGNMVNQDELDRRIAEFEGADEAEPMVVENMPPVETKKAPTHKVQEGIQKSLEDLIFIGRHSKVLDFAGHKFEISTLTHKEHNHVIEELMNLGQAADLFAIRIFTLAYAIRKIDNKTLDQIEVDYDFADDFKKKITIIDYLQLSLVEKLYAAYEELVKETNTAVYGENIKN